MQPVGKSKSGRRRKTDPDSLTARELRIYEYLLSHPLELMSTDKLSTVMYRSGQERPVNWRASVTVILGRLIAKTATGPSPVIRYTNLGRGNLALYCIKP